MMTRKCRWFIASLLTLLILGNPVFAAEKDLQGKITVWSWGGACLALELAGARFVEKYPGVEIEFVSMGRGDVYDKMAVGLLSGSGLPDVVSLEDDRVQTYIAKFPNGFADLSDIIGPIKDDFIQSKLAAVTAPDGKIMAFPWDAGPAGLLYRKDLFDAVGANADNVKTWDDYIEVGKRILELTDGKTKLISVDMKSDDDIFRLLLNQLGTYYFDMDGNPVIGGDKAIQAMSLLKRMNDEGVIYNRDGYGATLTGIQGELVASIPYGSWYTGNIINSVPEQHGKWAVMRIPAFEAGGNTSAMLGGSALLVTNASKNKEVALEFATFAMTDLDAVIEGFEKQTLLPGYLPAYDHTIFEEGVEAFGGQAIWKLFGEVNKDIPPLNYTANFAEAKESVINAQARILLRGADVEETLQELEREFEIKFGK